MKKLSKKSIENLVWSLWEGYECEQSDDLPEWGSYLKEEEQGPAREEVKQYVLKTVDVQEDVVEHLLNRIEHWRECVCYDDRELSTEVRDWSKNLHNCQGKRNSPEKIEFLRTEVNKVIDKYPKMYFLGCFGDDRKIVKEFSSKTGVPEDDAVQILHGCSISRRNSTPDDKKYREGRLEDFENELKEYSIHVKV